MPSLPLRVPRPLRDYVRLYGGQLDGGLENSLIRGIAAPDSPAKNSDLCLVVSSRFVDEHWLGAGAVLVASRLAKRVPVGRRWVHETPWWALAGVLDDAVPSWQSAPEPRVARDAQIAPSSVVHSGAQIGPGCQLEDHSVVHGGVVLGARVQVGAGSVIGRPGFGFAHGPAGESRRIPQLGGVFIADDVEIGALCSIDAGTLGPTRIGARTKLDAQVHIGHNVRVGQRCMLAAQVGLAGSVELGDDVWLGGQAGVADHVRIGNGARIAAKSGVIADVPAHAVVAGFPAVPRWRWLRGIAFLAHATKRQRSEE